MREIEEFLWANQNSPMLQDLRSSEQLQGKITRHGDAHWRSEINMYIAATGMDCDKTWGSEVETMVLSHLLDTLVYSYDTRNG